MLFRNLVLTILIESAVACLLHVRRRQHYLLFCGINLLTNFTGQLLVRSVASHTGYSPLFQVFGLVLEVVIFVCEALLLKRFAKDLPISPWTLSFYANLLSALIGMLLQLMI